MSVQQGAPSMDSLMAQATAMANQGGPGHNSAAAETWLQQQAAKYGYTSTTPAAGSPDVVGSISPDGTFTPNADNPLQQAQVGSGPSIVNGAQTWVTEHAANYGLVILGALLVLGALLISQKDTVIQVSKLAAVAA